MDPELYQQSVSEGFTEAAHWVAALRRVLVGSAVAALALLIIFWWNSVLEFLSVCLNSLRTLLPRRADRRTYAVYPDGWPSGRRAIVLIASGCTVALGVYAAALNLDGGQWRRERRFWQLTPDQIEDWFEGT